MQLRLVFALAASAYAYVGNSRLAFSALAPAIRHSKHTVQSSWRMQVIETKDFKIGVTIEVDGAPHKIVEYQQSKQARQAAVIRTKMKNLLTGNSIEKTFKSGETASKAMVEKEEVQYTYQDGDEYCFMNSETFEEERLQASAIDKAGYLEEGDIVNLIKWNEQVLDIELPQTKIFEVTYTEPGIKGDTSGKSMKPATVAAGIEVSVPLYVDIGDKIEINLEDDRFLQRK